MPIMTALTTKVLVLLLGFVKVSLHSEEAADTVRAFTANGEMYSITQGSRVLLTCDAEPPLNSEVISYKWQYSCTGGTNGRCDIREEHPYYKIANDTLLVDITSPGQQIRYHCAVAYLNQQKQFRIETGSSPQISVMDSSAAYLLTPTSVLLNHTLVINATPNQVNHMWIKCTSGDGEGVIFFVGYKQLQLISTSNITFSRYPANGLYYCFRERSRKYFSLYLRNSASVSTPIVTDKNTMWTFTTPDGSQVERYIVQFECKVRSITFVERYMSVSANGGSGQVPIRQSCFGIGQLYRLKVWAVSGPNISQAREYLIPDGQYREEGTTSTTQGSTATKLRPSPTSKSSSPGTDHADMQEDGSQSAVGTFIGVGIGVGVVILVMLTVVVVILVVVMRKRKAVYKQEGDKKTGSNPYYNSTVVVKQEVEMPEKGQGADYDYVDNANCEEKGSTVDGFDPYEDPDKKAQTKTDVKPASKESATPHWETNAGDVYAVVDKTKKKAVKKETKDEPAVTNKDDLYAMPMKKKGKMTNNGIGVVESDDVEEREENDNKVGLQYEPMADSESGQQNEGEGKVPNVDVLYAVVDKSRTKKK